MTIQGKWQLAIKTPAGLQTPTVELLQEGDAISGIISSNEGTGPIENPRLDGKTVTWTNQAKKPVPATIEFTVHVNDDNTLTGNVKLGPFGNAALTGKPI